MGGGEEEGVRLWRWAGGCGNLYGDLALVGGLGDSAFMGFAGVTGMELLGFSYWVQCTRWISHSKNNDSSTEDTQEILKTFYLLIPRDIAISPMTIPMPNPIAIRS